MHLKEYPNVGVICPRRVTGKITRSTCRFPKITEHLECDMNPTPEEDIMRQRSHRSAIVLATLLACLLFASDSARADGVTVIVPVNVTQLHEEVNLVYVQVSFINDQGLQVGIGFEARPSVDRSLQEDVEIVVNRAPNQNIMDATTYRIVLTLSYPDDPRPCEANKIYTRQTHQHCAYELFSKMQTYEPQEGLISDLIPE